MPPMSLSQILAAVTISLALTITAFAQPRAQTEPTQPISDRPSSRFLPSGYIRLAGESGTSIEVPSDWRVSSLQELAQVAKEAERLLPLGASIGKLEIYATAQQQISGAVISVAVQRPQSYSQKVLATISQSALQSISAQLQYEFKGKRSQSGIGTLFSDLTYEIQVMPGKIERAMVITYREEELSRTGRSLIWKTTHLQIPRGAEEVQVTLSYREADEVFWRPVMENAKMSLRY